MGLHVPPGQIEKFIGVFNKVNAKNPDAKPESVVAAPMDRLVISKGQLMILLINQTVTVTIPEEEQVDQETYESFLTLLVDALVNLLQVPQYTAPIMDAMRQHGIAAYLDEHPIRINPLTAGTGEVGTSVE